MTDNHLHQDPDHGYRAKLLHPDGTIETTLAILAGTLLLVVWLRNSRFGMSLQAIRDDSVSAAMAGVSVVRGRTISEAARQVEGLTGTYQVEIWLGGQMVRRLPYKSR